MHRLLTATALTLSMAGPALARDNWALLIGASTYDNLTENYWLKGPENDMDLVRSYLTSSGMGFSDERMIVLADKLDGARDRATLAAIRAAFAELAEKVQPGDFVYLHFSGHGTQAPALDPSTETDGLDELFLPVDIGPWDDTIGHVENALIDDEIGQMIDAIRAKGADVFAVFDSCHSGTATRGAPESAEDEVRSRQLPPSALGIRDEALARAEAAAMEAQEEQSRGMPPADPRERAEAPVDAGSGEGMGGFVYFYAAQTNETTPEKRLPKGAPDRRSQGVFTFTIFQTLAESPGITYRQLAQEVLRKYSVHNLTRTTPLFEGELDRVVFGAGDTAQIQQWPIKWKGDAITIDAGRLHGLAEGEKLAVLASPADPLDKALGWVTVSGLEIFNASLTASEIASDDIPKGAVLRKIETQLDYTLTVALPEGESDAAKLMRGAADLLLADPDLGHRLRFVPAGSDSADLRLAVLPESPRPDAIWILPESGMVELPAGVDPASAYQGLPSVGTRARTEKEVSEILSEMFVKMARAINVMKLGASTGGGGQGVKAGISRVRYDEASPTSVDETTRAVLDGANVPRMMPDDVVGARLENTSDGPVDYNILYIGADYSITWMGNGRMNPGEVKEADYVLITDEHFGRDRLVIVVTPAEPGTAAEDLSFLEQSSFDLTRDIRTGQPKNQSELGLALLDASFGETTRAAVSLKKKKADESRRPVILQFEMDTIPAK